MEPPSTPSPEDLRVTLYLYMLGWVGTALLSFELTQTMLFFASTPTPHASC